VRLITFAYSLEGNQPTGFEAQVLQGILRKLSNNLNDCIKLWIRILEVGYGLLVVAAP
jgi:hypothetical protein